MKKYVLIIVVLLFPFILEAQDTLTVFRCFEAMENYFPKQQEKALQKEQTKLKVKNIKTQWLPDVDLNAQSSYQSDVVEVDLQLDMPPTMGGATDVDVPAPSHDQHKVTLDVNQMIYDGGSVKASKEVEQAAGEINRQSVDVDLYNIREQVSEVYFGILLLKKQRSITETALDDLNRKLETVKSAVENGTLLKSDLYSLQAEKLKVKQSLDQMENQNQSNYQNLRMLTGLEVDTSTALAVPDPQITRDKQYNRPEHKLFELQKQRAEANKEVLKSQNLPKVFAFGQVGYGKPGLNMLSDEFNSFYIVGAKLSWNLWDWNKTKRQKQVLEVQQKTIDVQEQTFNKNLNIKLSRIQAEINNYERAMEQDKEIISLREKILKDARSKLQNGVITSTDYINDLNQLKKAKLTYEKHKIEWLKAKINYLFTNGNLD
jgi:outer membrane protein TolC